MNNRYMNPYLAGVGLGLVLLASFFVTGRGLGASGALKDVVVAGVDQVAPAHARRAAFYQAYLGPGKEHPLKSWLVFEVLGLVVGAFGSAVASGRLRATTERGPRLPSPRRWLFAAIGGALFALGAQFARGCTSGAALSGMAVLSTAGFVTMLAVFGTGYAVAYFGRRLWL